MPGQSFDEVFVRTCHEHGIEANATRTLLAADVYLGRRGIELRFVPDEPRNEQEASLRRDILPKALGAWAIEQDIDVAVVASSEVVVGHLGLRSELGARPLLRRLQGHTTLGLHFILEPEQRLGQPTTDTSRIG